MQFFPAQGAKDRIKQASAQQVAPLSPPQSIIVRYTPRRSDSEPHVCVQSISDSDESSIMPGSVTSKTVSGASDDEQDSDASIRVTEHNKPQPKFKPNNRVILDSDEEEDDDYEPAYVSRLHCEAILIRYGNLSNLFLDRPTPPVVNAPRNLASRAEKYLEEPRSRLGP